MLKLTCLQKLGLVDNWLVYEGDEVVEACGSCENESSGISKTKKPIWCVRKNVRRSFLGNSKVLARVYEGASSDKKPSFVVEGSYSNRSCTVMDERRSVVAEIKKKEAIIGGISFGGEVFVLVVQQGFDAGFSMALVLLMDQMF